MNKRRMQKSGCSMLAAALIGLLPVVAAHADDASPSVGQEPATDPMGAQGPLRQDDIDATQEGQVLSAPAPANPDMDTMRYRDQNTGAQGPVREDNGAWRQEYVPGAQGPTRADTGVRMLNCRVYMGEGNEFIDPGGVKIVPCRDYGAMGPLRYDSTYYGAQGPLRTDPETRAFMRYHGESNPLIDPGGARRDDARFAGTETP